MAPKLPACDPCRFSKLACDHVQPICSRCQDRKQPCVYRRRPFKKRKAEQTSAHPRASSRSSSADPSLARLLSKSRHYPNPGYLGSSSYTTFFNHLSPGHSDQSENDDGCSGHPMNEELVSHGAELIKQFHYSSKVLAWIPLVSAWIEKGINFALAESLTERCVQTVEYVLKNLDAGLYNGMELSRNLFLRTCSPLTVDANATIEDFHSKFCYDEARWETLGLFFTAVSRATIDIDTFDPLYRSSHERRSFQRLATHYSNVCLDIAISLDCLNDLQLMLQYENFILYTFIHGDQSYQSWRKLGDVTSSLSALGYHEQLEGEDPIPQFLKDLRQAAFARAYAADKNVGIFLGRPPRIHKKYSKVLPRHFQWAPDQPFSRLADTRWSSLCAALKEDILDLSREENSDERIQKARAIQADAEAHWAALPPHFRLQGSLMSCERRPVERDFLVNSRLDHLHVLFLLRLALVQRVSEPDARLLAVSVDMLSLVIEAVVLKDRLANSGISLVWKVVYYGLAAAGVVCLALLKKCFPSESNEVSVSKAIQDLSVLVAEVETGALVHPEDPNYALLAGATRTIKSLLSRIMSNDFARHPTTQLAPDPLSLLPSALPSDDLNHWGSHSLQDFETNFWLNLAEHPYLVESASSVQWNGI